MVPTSILWIGLALLALALLAIIGILSHRVNRASTVIVCYIATDRNGAVFLYDLKPSRNYELGIWEGSDGSEVAFVPKFMLTATEPPTWEEEPRLIELWMSTSPEMPPYPSQEDDEPF